jgi:hypothetical protein
MQRLRQGINSREEIAAYKYNQALEAIRNRFKNLSQVQRAMSIQPVGGKESA